MKWRLLLAVALGLSIADEASLAQGPPEGQRPDWPSRPSPADGYFDASGVVRFRLVGGRLFLDPPRHRKGSQQREAGGVYESITVTAERGIPSLHYVCETPAQRLNLSVEQATDLRIESRFPESAERSVLVQPEWGAIRWDHSVADETTTRTGGTLLHLRRQSPAAFDRHFSGLVTCLLRGRSLERLGDEAVSLMLRRLPDVGSPELDAVQAAVAELAGPRRQQRVAAERRLLQWGTPILPWIETIEPSQLEAEQALRLSRVRRKLRPRDDDTAGSLAMRLVNDAGYWGLLAEELSGGQRRAVNRHFVRVGMPPLPPLDTASEQLAARP